jgi:hypothetical protein
MDEIKKTLPAEEKKELTPTQKVLVVLDSLPHNYKITKKMFTVDQAKAEIMSGSEFGKNILDFIGVKNLSFRDNSGNLLGKRYFCLICGTEGLCTKAGTGWLSCDSQELVIIIPKPVASSD